MGTSGADGIQIHTKFVPDLEVLPRISRDYVEGIVDRSLRRLGVERLDLVQFAWWDYEIPGYVETAGWLQELRERGKIRHLGATNFDVGHLREIVKAGIDLVAHQVQYSLLDRRPEGDEPTMVDFCREHDIGLLCYGALGGGFLTRRWLGRDEPRGPLGSLENRSLTKYRLIIEEFGRWELFQELLTELDQGARETRQRVDTGSGESGRQVDLATVALRWVLDRPGVAAAVVGARTARHLESTLAAFDLEIDWAGVRRVLERAQGSRGEVYGLERDRESRHGRIMKYDLNRRADPPEA